MIFHYNNEQNFSINYQSFFLHSLYLHRNVESVQKVSTKDQGVDWCKHGVYPARGNHHCLTLFDHALVTSVSLISKKGLTLRRTAHPVLIQLQICLRRLYEVKHFLAAQHVIPHRRAAEVDVEIRKTVFDPH